MWNPGDSLGVQMTGGSALVRSKVRQFAEEWTKYANIRFVWDGTQTAIIKIDFDPDRSSWSAIGRDALSIPFNFSTMHFGTFNDNTSDSEFSRKVLHEFGHALGLIHEHQSPTAGIQWDKEKVYETYKKQNPPWDKGMVDRNIFDKYSKSSTNFSQFDPTSIMVYPIDASLTLNGQGIALNPTLSATDKQYIARWYPYPDADNGQLRPGQCNQVNFLVEYGVEEPDKVGFFLKLGNTVTWWKSIEVPIGGNQYLELEVYDNVSSSKRVIDKVALDSSRPIRFNAATLFGIHTPIGPSWDVVSALPGGSKVTFHWIKDNCSDDEGSPPSPRPPGSCPRGQRCCEPEPNAPCRQCVPQDAECR